MPSKSETAILALASALQSTGAVIERNTPVDLTMNVPASGLVIIRDGNPGDPEIILGHLDYQYDHEAEIEVYVRASGSQIDAAFDTLRLAVGQALIANRTLGGAVMWVEPRAAASVDLPKTSELPIKATTIAVTLTYSSPVPIN